MRQVYLIIVLYLSPVVYGQMVLSGTATGGCDCYTLTTTTSQAGSIWSPSTIDLTNSFDFTFRINMGFSDAGADGMIFVLRQSGTTTGLGGGDLGYGGLLNTIGVEIDTWNNGGADIPSDHIAMNSNGTINHDLVAPNAIANIEDGVDHDFRVVWDPALFEMEVFLDGASIFTYTGDIVTLFFGGDPNVYFGWTGSTGGASNIQTVCMDLVADFDVSDLNVCPDQEIDFTDLSESGLIYDGASMASWNWLFGIGGSTSDIPDPSHTFSTIGGKTVGLTVTNLVGCTDVETVLIIVDSIDVDISGTDITCFGFDDGTATADPLTGDAPYTYLWDDPLAQTTITAADLGPGVHTVMVTDAVGCEQTRSVTITEPDELLLDMVEVDSTTCGLADGELIITPVGGIPDYDYSIDAEGSFGPDSAFGGFAMGMVYYEVRDQNGCTYEDSVWIGADSLNVDITKTDITCFGFNDGVASATPEFDVAPVTYLWDDPAGQITPAAAGLEPGTYSVLVTHETGCAGIAEITITEPDELMLDDVAFTNASCGVSNGIITMEILGGTAPYSYSIDDGTTFGSVPDFTGLAPGDYDLIITDDNGCTVTDNVTLINVSNIPEIIIEPDFPEGCRTHEVNFTNLSDPLLTASTKWNLGDGSVATGDFVNHTYMAAGCYDVAIEITTFDGCLTDTVFEDMICVWELPQAEFSFEPQRPNIFNPDVHFINLSSFATAYEWDLGDGSNSNDFEPVRTYPAIGDRSYTVELIAISDKGCRDTTYKVVYIEEVVQFYVPNAFTPDGDNYNENFTPIFMTGFTPNDYHLVIYNRWGEILFESYDTEIGWDGTFGSDLVKDGTYIWDISFRENGTDKMHRSTGHVNVLR